MDPNGSYSNTTPQDPGATAPGTFRSPSYPPSTAGVTRKLSYDDKDPKQDPKVDKKIDSTPILFGPPPTIQDLNTKARLKRAQRWKLKMRKQLY